MSLNEKLEYVKKGANEIAWDITDLFWKTAVVVGADCFIPFPLGQYEHNIPLSQGPSIAAGFDLAIASGWVTSNEDRAWIGLSGLALSMTPELIRVLQGEYYGDFSTLALLKGAAYGGTYLVARGGKGLYNTSPIKTMRKRISKDVTNLYGRFCGYLSSKLNKE